MAKIIPWTNIEVETLKRVYPSGGPEAAAAALPSRGYSGVVGKASGLGLKFEGVRRRPNPKRIYFVTPQIDAAIARGYQTAEAGKLRGAINQLALDLGKPRWWISRRATEMGIVHPRKKEGPWKPEEDAILEANRWRSPKVIRARLLRAGFTRTETAVAVRRKRIHSGDLADPFHVTATGIAKLLGIDSHWITRRIESGELKAEKRGTARTEQQGGDMWWIKKSDLWTFIVENAALIDLRKVDRTWFIDFMAHERPRKNGNGNGNGNGEHHEEGNR